MMLHRNKYVASAVSTALSTRALRSDAFLIRLRNTAAAGGAVRKHCDSLQRLTPRAAGDAPLETFVRETIPRRAGGLARALLVDLPSNQCAAAPQTFSGQARLRPGTPRWCWVSVDFGMP